MHSQLDTRLNSSQFKFVHVQLRAMALEMPYWARNMIVPQVIPDSFTIRPIAFLQRVLEPVCSCVVVPLKDHD